MEAATQVGLDSGARDGLTTSARVVSLVLGIGYLVSGIVGALAGVSDDGSDLFMWLLLLVGGGVLVLAGAFALGSRPVVSAIATVIGALAGALAISWSVIGPVLALVLAALVIVRAVRSSRG